MQTISSGEVTTVRLDDVEYADGITADTAGYRLVIERAGYYVFTAQLGWPNVGNPSGYRGALIYTGPASASEIRASDYRSAVFGGATIHSVTTNPVPMNPGDEALLRALHTDSSGRAVEDTNGALYLSALWVRPL